MDKPLFDINEFKIETKCNQKCSLTIDYVVFVNGPSRICFDLPTHLPVFFAENGANSFSVTVPECVADQKKSTTVDLVFESFKKDLFIFNLIGSITDSSGNTRSDYIGVTLGP